LQDRIENGLISARKASAQTWMRASGITQLIVIAFDVTVSPGIFAGRFASTVVPLILLVLALYLVLIYFLIRRPTRRVLYVDVALGVVFVLATVQAATRGNVILNPASIVSTVAFLFALAAFRRRVTLDAAAVRSSSQPMAPSAPRRTIERCPSPRTRARASRRAPRRSLASQQPRPKPQDGETTGTEGQ
jgi:hypothetical protein